MPTMSEQPSRDDAHRGDPHPGEVVFVDDPGAVRVALESVAGDTVGVDVERADADRYFRRAALIQVGTAERCLLLDGVTIDRLPELDAFLDPGRTAVLHALENDLDPLASKGVHPDALADTAIAAAVLGLPIGLSGLLAEVLGVELTADKETYQRADWEARPLSSGMADYAAGDVFHLPALWHELERRLEEAGRRSWYDQELDHVVVRAAEDNRDWTRVKGSGRLDPAAKAVLRALWDERERLARTHDIAPNRLVHDDVLRDLAETPARTVDELVRRSPRRRGLLREHAADLLAAAERGREAPPEVNEEGARRWAAEDKAAYDAMRKARAEVAADLGIDAGVLCSSRPLWRAVAGRPSDGHELCALADLRPWQTDLLHEVLWSVYAAAFDGPPASAPRAPAPPDPAVPDPTEDTPPRTGGASAPLL
jgi:ribonuclease D